MVKASFKTAYFKIFIRNLYSLYAQISYKHKYVVILIMGTLSNYWDQISYVVQRNQGLSSITKTSPCNEHPLTPHFYMVTLGFTGYTFFLIFALKHRL